MDIEAGAVISLRYTFPCIGYRNTPGISPKEIAVYEEILKLGKSPPRNKLNGLTLRESQGKLFPKAVGHYKSWSVEDVRDYWLREHNIFVENDPSCSVYWGEVSKILPQGIMNSSE